MKSRKMFYHNLTELTNYEKKFISGGSETTENVTRGLAYIIGSFFNIDWVSSSWFNGNARAQR